MAQDLKSAIIDSQFCSKLFWKVTNSTQRKKDEKKEKRKKEIK